MCFPRNDANCERDPFSRVCPRVLCAGWRGPIIPLSSPSWVRLEGPRGREMSQLVCDPCAPSSAKAGKGLWKSPGVHGAPGRGWLWDRHCVCDSSCAMAAPGLGVAGCSKTQSCSCLSHAWLWHYKAPQHVTPPLGHHDIPKDTTLVHGTPCSSPPEGAMPCGPIPWHVTPHSTCTKHMDVTSEGFFSPDAMCPHSHP